MIANASRNVYEVIFLSLPVFKQFKIESIICPKTAKLQEANYKIHPHLTRIILWKKDKSLSPKRAGFYLNPEQISPEKSRLLGSRQRRYHNLHKYLG
jgi:hypothetical protein